MNPNVEQYISESKKWSDELRRLRAIALDCRLVEEFKWRVPCYTFEGGNVLLISELKEYCALGFPKGALLNDTHDILMQPGPNTRAARLIRITSVQQILEMEPTLKTYIDQAIEVERAGLKVNLNESTPPAMPEELRDRLDEMPTLKSAFAALTPGRQRAYILHFAAAKQSKTRQSRIDMCIPRIHDGKGLNDCTCGLSKKLPQCDGSHKSIR